MKNIFAALLASAAVCQLGAAEKKGDITTVGDAAYMLVSVFDTPDQNVNFQRNLNVMQRDSLAADFLKKKIAAEKDAAKKTDLESKLKTLEANFAANDAAMRNAYGFVSSRKYKFVFLESNICVPLSNDELAMLKDSEGNKLDPMKVFSRGARSFYVIKKISGTRENEKLQRMISFVVNRRAEIEKMRKELADTTDAQKQLDITTRLGQGEKAVAEAEENLRKDYGIKSRADYIIETAKSKLYLILTPEEFSKIKAANGK